MRTIIDTHTDISHSGTETQRLPCSDATRTAGADPRGSGTQFTSFVLLDYRSAWGRYTADDAVRDLLDPAAAALVAAASGPDRLRPFATRPVRQRRERPPVAPRAGRAGQSPLLTRMEHLPRAEDINRISAGDPPGEATNDIVIGVCTNGKRDRCCAVRGRPVAAELEARFGESITEISHLGGHRFAATMLVLPSGYSYGFLEPDQASVVVAAALEGLVHPAGLRGRSDLSAAGQAADAYWREQLGPAPIDAVRIDTVESDRDDAHVVAQVDGRSEALDVRWIPGPILAATGCSSKPIQTGRWETAQTTC